MIRVSKVRTFLADAVRRAREFVYNLGLPINGTNVNNLLKETSSIPTFNAFVDRLGADFDLSKMFAVDLLHEIELGVWKTLFTHLIHILYASENGAEKVAELDRRFRQIPAFGTTIRHFLGNASEMKKLAARDFEDLLQCAIPAFEGLLNDEHNDRLMKLLYRLAQWHALAKLRLHTDSTLDWLETTTHGVGKLMREFRDKTASQFATVELPREQDARARRQTTVQRQRPSGSNSRQHSTQEAVPGNQNSAVATPRSAKKSKNLNLLTYKFHAIGDYVSTIRAFGTTDNYSTQIGELAHRKVKQFYGLTNKRNAAQQIAKRYNRERQLQKAKAALKKADRGQMGQTPSSSAEIFRRHAHHVGIEASTVQDGLKVVPNVHHFISQSRNHPIHLHEFLQKDNPEDPAKKHFVLKLQDHLLARFLKREFDGDTDESFTDEDRNTIILYNHKMFAVKTMRINYTTYDVRRDQDIINPRTDHCTVMVRSPDTSPNVHPYWYARVLGIFHADVIWLDKAGGGVQQMERMEFLWVRWFGEEPGYRWGIKSARLPKVGFVPGSDEYAFGFLDPSLVVRACHLIPDFVRGRTTALLCTQGYTAARPITETDDWSSFYVSIFVDRDMFMRHLGGGVGHTEALPSHGHNDNCESDESDSENENDVAAVPATSVNATIVAENEGEGDESEGSEIDDDESRDDLLDEVDADDSDGDLGPADGEDMDEDDGYGSM
ncbi:hypothetical protein VKT23_013050 [Stygiomarasmius scandens]|uniref:Uncharacterized protein n=1 Tax=Marasmiellus scandens TaxID=2682957 RepID=A0ABR1J707_9AGAR